MSGTAEVWVAVAAEDARGFESLRAEARKSLAALGLPTRKTEAFRTFPTRELLELPRAPAARGDVDARAVEPMTSGPVVVVRGGRLETPFVGPGLTLRLASESEAIGTLAPARHFVAANAAAFPEALLLEAHGGDAAVELVYVGAAARTTTPRVLVRVAEGARLCLVERFFGPAEGFTNHVAELHLERASYLEHVVIATEPQALVGTIAVRLARGAHYKASTALRAGAPARLDHQVQLDEPDASASLNGVLVGDGDAYVDHHVRVIHAAPSTQSRMRFRGIAGGRSTVVWDGIAEVRDGAAGCDVVQESKNLLFGREATVHAKPHLEIAIDEVTASHGTTIGTLDDDALFYLRSRGIGENEARALLMQAFAGAALSEVSDEGLRERLLELAGVHA